MNVSDSFEAGTNGHARTNGHAPPATSVRHIEDDEISLREIVSILLKGRWIIAASFATVLGLATLYTVLKAPEYEASSMLYVDNQQAGVQLGEVLGLQALTDSRNILNEIEILKSRTIAHRVAESLQDIQFVPGTRDVLPVLEVDEGEEPLTTHELANRLREHYVEVSPVSREVDLIDVVATSTVPNEAALIANLFAQEYVDYNRSSSRAQVTASREFLADVSARYADSLQMSEDQLMSFLDRERLVAPDEEARQLLEQVAELQKLQYQTQIELGTAQTQLSGLEAEVERIRPDLAERIASGNDAIIDQLTRRIAEKDVELEEKYARNPALRENPTAEVRQLEEEVATLRERLNERSRRLVENVVASGGGVSLDSGVTSAPTSQVGLLQGMLRQITEQRIAVRALEARQGIVEAELEVFLGRLNDLPRKEIVLNRMRRNLETRQQLYVTLIEKLQEARIAEQSELGYVEIIDPAIEPVEPVRPRVPLNLALGAILGLMLGVGLAFVRNAFDNKVRDPEQLRRSGFSVAGVIPDLQPTVKSDFGGRELVEVDGRTYNTVLVTLLNPLAPASEAYRRLRTNLRFSRPDGDVKTIVMTSSNPAEGKTSTSLNLAITMAQAGRRTVYVDADLRRARGHRMVGIRREPGLTDVLFAVHDFEAAAFATGVDDLFVIPAGAQVPNPSEILGSEKMHAFVQRLRDEFDVVIIDSPPLHAVADALMLSRLSDVTVVIARSAETTWHALERTRDSLRDVGTTKPLVVLNRFDPKHASYAYGYGYGETYAYKEAYGDQPAVPLS